MCMCGVYAKCSTIFELILMQNEVATNEVPTALPIHLNHNIGDNNVVIASRILCLRCIVETIVPMNDRQYNAFK